MAVVSLQAESARANPTQVEILYRAWRYARAQWDLADHDPANPEGLTDDQRDAFCDVEHAALVAFLTEPASTLRDVARKMRVMRQEKAWEFTQCGPIMERIQRDVHCFAFGFDPGEE
jgi:hypothetical protein